MRVAYGVYKRTQKRIGQSGQQWWLVLTADPSKRSVSTVHAPSTTPIDHPLAASSFGLACSRAWVAVGPFLSGQDRGSGYRRQRRILQNHVQRISAAMNQLDSSHGVAGTFRDGTAAYQ